MRNLAKWFLCLAGFMAIAVLPLATVQAHPDDDLVMASYITLTEDAVILDVDLRPGMDVGAQLVALLDANGDGIISDEEATLYADEVTADLMLELNGEAVELDRIDLAVPSISMLQDGLGIIRLRFSVPLPSLEEGTYEIFYENAFVPEDMTSSYLVNGFVQAQVKDHIEITEQDRDWYQQSITIRYIIIESLDHHELVRSVVETDHALDDHEDMWHELIHHLLQIGE